MKIDGGNVMLQGTVGLQLSGAIVSVNGGCTKVMRQNGAGTTPATAFYTC